jgi:hypothetical protein
MMREVEARLKISAVDKTGRVFKGVADKMGEINRRAAAYNRQQGMLMRSTAEMYATIARYAAPAALAYGVKASITEFAALERQMTRIGITADASAKQTSEAFAEAQRVAKDLNYDSVQPAIEALDTLVASGKSLEEAMAFLPSVLATAQASGAATADIANTGLKAADALKIETAQLQRAFDIMVTGGRRQFELKDMAQYIPSLANSFSSLGYRGEDGLRRLVAILQTIREDTGDASAAATQAQNIFGKMFSGETMKKFGEFGIDLRKEMKAAAAAGEDAVSAFVRLSKEAIDGDYTKLPLLFTDQEFRLGMQSLMTSSDSLERFLEGDELGRGEWTSGVIGNKVMSDTQARQTGCRTAGSDSRRPSAGDRSSRDRGYGRAVIEPRLSRFGQCRPRKIRRARVLGQDEVRAHQQRRREDADGDRRRLFGPICHRGVLSPAIRERRLQGVNRAAEPEDPVAGVPRRRYRGHSASYSEAVNGRCASPVAAGSQGGGFDDHCSG